MPNLKSMASGDLVITLSRVGSFRAGRHGDCPDDYEARSARGLCRRRCGLLMPFLGIRIGVPGTYLGGAGRP
jgi:hypothetical protein